MEEYFKQIEKKLREKIKFEKFEIINNSEKHRGHKFFSEDSLHLKLNIKSSQLNSLSRINAQKLIMRILKEDLKKKFML